MEGRRLRFENSAALPRLAKPAVEILESRGECDKIGALGMFQHEVGSL
jgi:hypothetical protein